MSHVATSPKGIPEELLDRMLLALFWGICFLLGNTLLAPVKDAVLYASLAALWELFTIQAMRGLFSNTPLVRDANELNFDAFLIHLIVIPFILYGAQTDWHNYAINGMIVFYLVRLLYFGERRADGEFTGWAKFGALAWANYFIEKAANTLTKKRVFFAVRIIITLATIIPLWVITARTHDQTTSLYTVLTTSFILIYGYVKHIMASRKTTQAETLLNDETIELCKAYNERSSDARRVIQRIVVEEFNVPKNTAQAPTKTNTAFDERLSAALAELEDTKRHRTYLGLGILFVLLMMTVSLHTEKKAMFKFGYATGYTDGKGGVEPKSETSWDRVFHCHNRDARFPASDKDCLDKQPE